MKESIYQPMRESYFNKHTRTHFITDIFQKMITIYQNQEVIKMFHSNNDIMTKKIIIRDLFVNLSLFIFHPL